MPIHMGVAIGLIQSKDSIVNLFWKHPHRHTQKKSAGYLGPCGPVRWIHKCIITAELGSEVHNQLSQAM